MRNLQQQQKAQILYIMILTNQKQYHPTSTNPLILLSLILLLSRERWLLFSLCRPMTKRKLIFCAQVWEKYTEATKLLLRNNESRILLSTIRKLPFQNSLQVSTV
jgi:hypothetical protein